MLEKSSWNLTLKFAHGSDLTCMEGERLRIEVLQGCAAGLRMASNELSSLGATQKGKLKLR